MAFTTPTIRGEICGSFRGFECRRVCNAVLYWSVIYRDCILSITKLFEPYASLSRHIKLAGRHNEIRAWARFNINTFHPYIEIAKTEIARSWWGLQYGNKGEPPIRRHVNILRPRKMDAIFQTTFSNVFSSMKMCEFLLKFHWSLFLGVLLTMFHHWFR